jgi:hypothetical protein
MFLQQFRPAAVIGIALIDQWIPTTRTTECDHAEKRCTHERDATFRRSGPARDGTGAQGRARRIYGVDRSVCVCVRSHAHWRLV